MMKTISKNYMYHVYKSGGRYYIDFYRPDVPIHSYPTIKAVKECLYYGGYIDSKTADI